MSLTKRWLDEMMEQGEIIYAYTDGMALDDGVLVDIECLGLSFESRPINRITSALFWQEQPKYPLTEAQRLGALSLILLLGYQEHIPSPATNLRTVSVIDFSPVFKLVPILI
jgi:hypothetical protein